MSYDSPRGMDAFSRWFVTHSMYSSQHTLTEFAYGQTDGNEASHGHQHKQYRQGSDIHESKARPAAPIKLPHVSIQDRRDLDHD